MPADTKSDLRLEIAHVLFIDIVGYSKLLINEQRESLQELNQIVRGTETFRAAEAAGQLTCIPIADGGINMAQRVMDCGDAGHILLSKRVAEDLAQYRQWQRHLHDLGE